MRTQSASNKTKKSKTIKRTIIALSMISILAMSILWAYAAKYCFTEYNVLIRRVLFLDDYVLSYEMIKRPRNIREDILFHNVGEQCLFDWESGEAYGYPVPSSHSNVHKIRLRSDLEYLIFEEENGRIQLGKFYNLYPIAFKDMGEDGRKESLRGIYKAVLELVYEADSSGDIKSVRFARSKGSEAKIKGKKYTDRDTLINVYDMICGLEPNHVETMEEYDTLRQPDCDIMVKFKNGRKIIFYYNSTYKILYDESRYIFGEISGETNDYIASLISI